MQEYKRNFQTANIARLGMDLAQRTWMFPREKTLKIDQTSLYQGDRYRQPASDQAAGLDDI